MLNENNKEVQHIFIIGSKGIPAQYGGFETFVEKLTQCKISSNIQYHVACATDDISEKGKEFIYNKAHCFCIKWRNLYSAKAIFYDLDAFKWSLDYVEKNGVQHPIFYVLACRIGPFIKHYKNKVAAIGGKLYVNPDGHEWLRAKWSYPVRMYWKISEALMVKQADLLICDSRNIEKYIHSEYESYNPKTIYIAYGAETSLSKLKDNDLEVADWYAEKKVRFENYYLVVGRFVPENNYEIMIKEFMKSKTDKDFILVTGVTEEFLEILKKKTGFHKDARIKFVGTVYNQELLKKIREKAFAYLHGHEVGGTNPSLLEALGATGLNLLLDVNFNKEVAEDGALYWNKEDGNLSKLIDHADTLDDRMLLLLSEKAKNRIEKEYSWNYIIMKYEDLFLKRVKV